MPNFKTKGLAVRKLKEEENCENERREKASFVYNFVQKSNATEQLWWHFYQLRNWFFFRRFSAKNPFEMEL